MVYAPTHAAGEWALRDLRAALPGRHVLSIPSWQDTLTLAFACGLSDGTSGGAACSFQNQVLRSCSDNHGQRVIASPSTAKTKKPGILLLMGCLPLGGAARHWEELLATGRRGAARHWAQRSCSPLGAEELLAADPKELSVAEEPSAMKAPSPTKTSPDEGTSREGAARYRVGRATRHLLGGAPLPTSFDSRKTAENYGVVARYGDTAWRQQGGGGERLQLCEH
ncbi:hypothetical protein PHYSODRAFT_321748 [Phytophthora sojae]|uniref:Uncharacterized protein n=1 Tax=Phytophthora sojae (strain P6497) TaxID=1094619 RepID=G4YG03_PHYSP|nr:hypothetical protein PHYSODRAFT_321748 [Phytophthora sojae]EGZ28051.1 hypothetical protein PHYSODRAFT_321748 [Phytophthora sojae]|eukprot:XP_009515326.1 hypothetical protein PHYSODRAFT_321748 [Phytophthora sojae]